MSDREGFGADTDRTGHFQVGGVKPGRYRVIPTLRGFVDSPARDGANALIQIKAGLNQDLKVEMVPHAIVTGRVFDNDGEPVQGIRVQLERAGDSTGGAAGAQTDDRGIYRIVTAPGRFYAKASYFRMARPEKRTDGSVPFRPVPTYYPAAATKDSAIALDAAAGRETGGIDIRMGGPGSGARSFAISGVVTGLPDEREGRVPNVIVREKRPIGGSTRGSMVSSDGRFRIEGLAPGEYDVVAAFDDVFCPPKTVTLSDGDVSNLELRLLSPFTVPGRLVVKGDPPGPLKDKWVVSLQATDMTLAFQRMQPSADVAADGTFQLNRVLGVNARVRLTTAPEGACVHSLKVDGAEVAGAQSVTFSGPESSLTVNVSRKCGVIAGVVKASDGSALQDAMGYVMLVADPNRLDFMVDSRWQVPIGAGGRFEFKTLSPGKYRVVAMDAVQPGIRSPEDFIKLAALQKEIEVKEGDRLNVEVKLMTREDVRDKK